MTQSKEFQKIIREFLFILLFISIIGSVFTWGSLRLYQKNLLEEKAQLLDAIVVAHPEMEDEMIRILRDELGDGKEFLEQLEKYGIEEEHIAQLKGQRQLATKIWFGFFTTFLLLALGIIAVYMYHLSKFYKKLGQMSHYMQDVLNNKYTFHLQEFEEGTFSVLENDIYQITHRLLEQKESISKDKRYLEETLSDISHQLKTPLTSMYMLNNLLEDEHLDPKLRKEFLHKNEAQLERIEWLVSSLLKLSRLESGVIQFNFEEVRVVDLLKAALSPLEIAIEVKEQKIKLIGDKKTTIRCDFNWTKEAFVNLIKNAHEHTGVGGLIELAWSDNPLYVAVTITDHGEGIEKEDLKHIFERFYKGKSNDKDSIGIGLNMTKGILDREQGDISVESVVGKGTTFTVKFYKNIV